MITKKPYPIHTKTKNIAARIPVPLYEKINELSLKTNRTKSDIITQILTEYFVAFNFESEE